MSTNDSITRGEATAFPSGNTETYGLTKLEYFSAQAMIGMLASGNYVPGSSETANRAIDAGKELIKRLNDLK